MGHNREGQKKCCHWECSNVPVVKFQKKWFCRKHLCPEPDEDYLRSQIENLLSMKSAAGNWETVGVETIGETYHEDSIGGAWEEETELEGEMT